MTMRLLEAEVRAASMTASAPGPRFTTQASNFSLRRRSAALPDMGTDSMPNCRKQSVRMERVESLRSIMAMRAAAFFFWGMGARAVPKAFCIDGRGTKNARVLFWLANGALAKVLGVLRGYKSVVPEVELDVTLVTRGVKRVVGFQSLVVRPWSLATDLAVGSGMTNGDDCFSGGRVWVCLIFLLLPLP